mmetsp:Transcript_28623/g.111862  ORF Transcript_28623/g.111862 Transcript_28623/m.111862 type:complete len:97 (-) Transcript_28623:570-860(-)
MKLLLYLLYALYIQKHRYANIFSRPGVHDRERVFQILGNIARYPVFFCRMGSKTIVVISPVGNGSSNLKNYGNGFFLPAGGIGTVFRRTAVEEEGV